MTAEPTPSPRCFALVPCAGSGSRASTGSSAPLPKQYVAIDGKAMVSHTLQALAGVARLASVLVVTAPGDDAFLQHVALPAGKHVAVARCGGATRARSVAAGLDALLAAGAHADDWVLVHDAARCLVRPAWIDALIDACLDDPVGGLLALPVADTLKHATADPVGHAGGPTGVDRVDATWPRVDVWQAQTPQMFRIGMLAEALARFGAEATDDASAIEAMGHAPRLVLGAAENFKVTHRADIALAASILRGRRT